jgi:methionine synthase I (cobalamin-dependent)
MLPQEFAGILKDCAAMGAGILGGCCGTDPSFIAAVAEQLGK